MRLPFFQVPQLDMSRGRTLARILRIPEAHGIGLTVALDAWAVEEAPEGDVSGLVRDPHPADAMAVAVGWDGEPGALLAALVRVKLVEETPDGLCVVSVRRYEQALTGSVRRSEAGRVAAYARWHGKMDADRIGIASATACDPMRSDAYTQTQREEDLPPPSSAATRGELALEVQEPPKRARSRKPPPDKPADPRHAPLTKELCEIHGWPHHGGRTAKTISSLLELAAQGGQREDAGYHEVVRRAVLARASEGFPRVRELHELVTHWGHFAEPRRNGQGPPDGLEAVPQDACAGCGRRGQGGSVGEPDVWLGYECGCLPAFTEAQGKGLHFTKAADWAAQRRKA